MGERYSKEHLPTGQDYVAVHCNSDKLTPSGVSVLVAGLESLPQGSSQVTSPAARVKTGAEAPLRPGAKPTRVEKARARVRPSHLI